MSWGRRIQWVLMLSIKHLLKRRVVVNDNGAIVHVHCGAFSALEIRRSIATCQVLYLLILSCIAGLWRIYGIWLQVLR